jgi:single-stranded DNA-binding protein
MNLNTTVLVGRISKTPALFYRKDGVAVLRFVLLMEDKNEKLNRTFKTAVPCELVGDRAEQVGAELEAGDIVLIKGRLAYRSTAEQAGGALGVYCQVVQCLEHAEAVPF